jgi:two-component sensor histidine kinase
MALVHEKLYRSKDLGRIGFSGYVRDLAVQLFRSFGAEDGGVRLELDIQDIEVTIDFAVPCGLVLHELLSNALKHAFPPESAMADGACPTIRIRSAMAEDGAYRIEVGDNGVGIPAGKEAGDNRTLGMQLINALVEQLGGSLEAGGEGDGTTFRLKVFPERGET